MTATAKLRNDNIITIHDTGDHNGLPFYTMDYVDVSLAKILHNGPLPGRKAAEHLEKVARAVDFANRQGVIHRDIKPHNILLDRGKPLLADLGLVAVMEELLEGKEEGQIVGTPAYMAPEQAARRESGPAADVYGLGATLYHLITGRPPHQSADKAQTRNQVISAETMAPRKLNPSIDRDLEAITLKCLEKEPERRYATAGLLADDLQRYREGRPVWAKVPSRFDRIHKWVRREPIKAGLIGGILFLLAILFIAEQWNHRRVSRALATRRLERNRADKKAVGSRAGTRRSSEGKAKGAGPGGHPGHARAEQVQTAGRRQARH